MKKSHAKIICFQHVNEIGVQMHYFAHLCTTLQLGIKKDGQWPPFFNFAPNLGSVAGKSTIALATIKVDDSENSRYKLTQYTHSQRTEQT